MSMLPIGGSESPTNGNNPVPPLDKEALLAFSMRLAFPESVVHVPLRDQINMSGAYYDVGGITVAQYAHLTLLAALLASNPTGAVASARLWLPTVLQEMARSNTFVERSFDPPPHKHEAIPYLIFSDPLVSGRCRDPACGMVTDGRGRWWKP